MKEHHSIAGLVLRVLLWIPPLFTLWYLTSIIITQPVHWLCSLSIGLLPGGWVTDVEQEAYMLNFVLPDLGGMVHGSSVSAPSAAIAETILTINPMIYGYGLPLYSALILASPDKDLDDKWPKWLIGITILLLVQTFGVMMEVIKTIALELNGAITTGLSSLTVEIIALGYQLGTLMLPAVTPIVLWLALYRNFVSGLSSSVGSTPGNTP